MLFPGSNSPMRADQKQTDIVAVLVFDGMINLPIVQHIIGLAQIGAVA